MGLTYDLLKTSSDCSARLGMLELRGLKIPTPTFMPVGTRGVVKTMAPEDIRSIGYQLILGNAYHLYLRPGHELVRDFGGLHSFMNWKGAILTDSGGFQVFSLSKLRKVSEEGVLFQSHIDGSTHNFTPERSIAVQEALGSDIIMCLDDVIGYPASREQAVVALERTTRWAIRCANAKKTVDPALFGIVQGSMFPDLRETSARSLTELPLAGYAVGGLSVGEPREVMIEMMGITTPMLPADRPRYVMGVGKPQDIIDGVMRGVDLFDCVLPTRNARNGTLFTSQGSINIRNAQYRTDPGPIDPNCRCPLCSQYSRAYLRHLFVEKEIYGLHLATYHNLTFYFQMMEHIRSAIMEDRLTSYARDFIAGMEEHND